MADLPWHLRYFSARKVRRWLAAIAVCSATIPDNTLLAQDAAPTGRINISDDAVPITISPLTESDESEVQQASLLQPPALLTPPIRAMPETPVPSPAAEFARDLLGGPPRTALSPTQLSVGQLLQGISGDEARGRVSADIGSLMSKSPSALGAGVQKRNPIINEPRVRGSRIGSLAASGSYWIPARIDLDTMLSKIDSRIVDQVVVVPGPYSVLNGPGLQSVQFDLLQTPRYDQGAELHGSTSANYLVNGQQFYGRQDLSGGGETWGMRFGYGHRTGNDYRSGSNADIPSSYNSRDINFSFGTDLSPDSSIEFTYLRLDQTNVELPGQAFDIDYLGTDAYDLTYLAADQPYFDQLTAHGWYNRTRLKGSAQRSGKRREFPFLDDISFIGNTDVDAMSTGYRVMGSWGEADTSQLTFGTDLRFVNQELNEIVSYSFGINNPMNANSPIPDSNWVNPGLFLREIWQITDRWQTTFGARADVVSTRIVDDPAKLAGVGTFVPPDTYAQIVGTNIQDRTFNLWAAYVTTRYQGDDGWSLQFSAGHGQRAPSLTELYVAQSFMFVLQNGLNTLTGDPRFAPERMWQMDLALAHQGERLNGQVRVFQSWIHNYITFENTGVVNAPPFGQTEQINYKYVNTDLATLAGIEFLTNYELTEQVTPFAMLQFVRGQDETRNGHFATLAADPGVASERVYGQPRGFFSGVAGNAKEPLPQIIPLLSRVGFRVHDPDISPRWTWELAARLVGPQNRIAHSLLELPTAGFATGDFRAYWRPSDNWVILGGVENLTNRNYREHLDFRPQPGTRGLGVFQPGISCYAGVERLF